MAADWKVCEMPESAMRRANKVSLYVGRRNRYLSIGQGLMDSAGLKVGDFVTIEHQGSRYRVRKVQPTDKAARGTLTGNRHGKGSKYSTGGLILFAEGVKPGVFDGISFPGYITFDAAEKPAEAR